MIDEAAELCAEALAERIAPIYKLLNWTWVTVPDPGVPSKEDIKKNLIRLYREISELDTTITSSGSGGLEVTRNRDEEGHTSYVFSLRIEEYLDYHEGMLLRSKR